MGYRLVPDGLFEIPDDNHQSNSETVSEFFLVGADMFLIDGNPHVLLDEHIRVLIWLASFGLCLDSLWVELTPFMVSARCTLLSDAMIYAHRKKVKSASLCCRCSL
jgi:hypothetical protein